MLRQIAREIKKNPNIKEKRELSPIIVYVKQNSFKSQRIHKDMGEDSAAILNNKNNMLTLLTTDRIKTKFVKEFPFGAGFSSILVGVDDIYACGGTPLASSVIVSAKSANDCKKILEGICSASNRFQVPIIRGHTNTRGGECYELSSTLIGEIKQEDYISAGGAQDGDDIVLAVDFDGKRGKASKYYWDTVTYKTSEEVLSKRQSMLELAKKHLVNSSKDVSNGGIFGTLLQLIKYSGLSANVNVKKIEIPPILKEMGYKLEEYIKMYLTTSFLLTVPSKNSKSVLDHFKKHQIHSNIIGKIMKGPTILKINNGEESVDVLKF